MRSYSSINTYNVRGRGLVFEIDPLQAGRPLPQELVLIDGMKYRIREVELSTRVGHTIAVTVTPVNGHEAGMPLRLRAYDIAEAVGLTAAAYMLPAAATDPSTGQQQPPDLTDLWPVLVQAGQFTLAEPTGKLLHAAAMAELDSGLSKVSRPGRVWVLRGNGRRAILARGDNDSWMLQFQEPEGVSYRW